MSEVQPNNAAVEIQRRKAIQDAKSADDIAKEHKLNAPAIIRPRSAAIHPSRMKLAEYERQDWIVNAEPAHTLEDLVKPGYWAHMAQQMNPYDHIEVRAEDGSWIAELIVINVDRSWARVILTNSYDLKATAEQPLDVKEEHQVEWKGPQHRFCVIRQSDQVSVRGNFQTKDEATAWMKEHERVIAG